MAARVQHRRWRLREIVALAVWAVFGISLLLSPFDWSPLRRALSFTPKIKEAVIAPIIDNDEIYTGSIVFVPPAGNSCWLRALDNRTGLMWDKGYVDCNDAVQDAPGKPRRPTMSGERMQAISKALRGGN